MQKVCDASVLYSSGITNKFRFNRLCRHNESDRMSVSFIGLININVIYW